MSNEERKVDGLKRGMTKEKATRYFHGFNKKISFH